MGTELQVAFAAQPVVFEVDGNTGKQVEMLYSYSGDSRSRLPCLLCP